LVIACQSQFIHQAGENVLKENEVQLESWSRLKNAVLERLQEVNQEGGTGELFTIGSTLEEAFKLLRGPSFPTALATNISQQCSDDSRAYVKALYSKKAPAWATQMKESTARGMPLGIHKSINLYAYGLFDECLAVREPSLHLKGKYCNVFFKIEPLPESHTNVNLEGTLHRRKRDTTWTSIFQLIDWLGFKFGKDGKKIEEPKVGKPTTGDLYSPGMGYCIPSSCSAADFGKSIAQIVEKYAFNGLYVFPVTSEQYCFSDDEDAPQFDGLTIAVIVVLSVIGLLVVAGTAHEVVRFYLARPIDPKTSGLPVRALHSFSALNNSRKLLATKATAENFGCLNGMRVLSTAWVVIGHCFLYASGLGPNQFMIEADSLKWSFQAIGNATISVDTFFLISGMLVSYLLLRELDRNKGRFNIFIFYLHRYLRLTPVYAIILGFIATLMVYIGSGPNWGFTYNTAEACRNEWWHNFLYINNFFDPPGTCMGETWYLANDMQFFLISPLFIYTLWRWRMFGFILIAVTTLASLGGTVAEYIVYDLPPEIMASRQLEANNPHFFGDYYIKPWTRIPPYLVGIVLGHILSRTKKSPIILHKGLVAFCWAVAIATGLAVMYGLSALLDPIEVPVINDATRVIYGVFHRLAWAFAVGWVIFACVNGYGGFVNQMLSWKIFAPLSRMTYCVYLIHLNFLSVYYGRLRAPVFYTILDEVMFILSVLMMTFGLAFIVSVTVEASFINLEKLLFSSFTGKPASRNPQPIAVDKMVDPEALAEKSIEKESSQL